MGEHHCCPCGGHGKAVVPAGTSQPRSRPYQSKYATSLFHVDVGLGRILRTGADVESHVGRLVVACLFDLLLARRGAGLDWRNHAAATSAGCADQDREGSLGPVGGVGDLAQPCIRGAGGLWQDGIGRTPTAFAADSQQERRPPAGQKHMPRQAPRGMGLDSRSAHRVGGHLRGRTRAARTEPSLGRTKCERSAVACSSRPRSPRLAATPPDNPNARLSRRDRRRRCHRGLPRACQHQPGKWGPRPRSRA